MRGPDRNTDSDSSLAENPADFRADPGAYWPMIIVCAVLALLATIGTVWGAIKPGPVDVLRILVPPFLALLAVVCTIGVRYYWLQLHRRYRLVKDGLEYFDGRQTHEVPWKSVSETYEVVFSVKLLGLTVDSPHLGVALVTSEGVRCEIDKNVQGADQLAPIVSREVNRWLSERARKKLERRQGVPFGCISLSETGVAIQEPPPKPWRFESWRKGETVVVGWGPWS